MTHADVVKPWRPRGPGRAVDRVGRRSWPHRRRPRDRSAPFAGHRSRPRAPPACDGGSAEGPWSTGRWPRTRRFGTCRRACRRSSWRPRGPGPPPGSCGPPAPRRPPGSQIHRRPPSSVSTMLRHMCPLSGELAHSSAHRLLPGAHARRPRHPHSSDGGIASSVEASSADDPCPSPRWPCDARSIRTNTCSRSPFPVPAATDGDSERRLFGKRST